MSRSQHVIEATRQWLDQVVIRHNFCPFARFVRDAGGIRYRVCEDKTDAALTLFASECFYLSDNPDTATTLLMFTHHEMSDFDGFLDLLDAANGLLKQLDLEGVYQLASFHPEYQFEGTTAKDAGNYTNRSPYPTLHLLRESDIEQALHDYAHPEEIYEANIAMTNKLGQAHFEKTLNAIKKHQS